jgi:hypothetical protein
MAVAAWVGVGATSAYFTYKFVFKGSSPPVAPGIVCISILNWTLRFLCEACGDLAPLAAAAALPENLKVMMLPACCSGDTSSCSF